MTSTWRLGCVTRREALGTARRSPYHRCSWRRAPRRRSRRAGVMCSFQFCIGGWFVGDLTYGPLAILSTASVAFFLFQAPVPCCAENRDGTFCRNNATGILGGCHYKQHKWQNFKLLVRRQSWARLGRGLFRHVSGHAAAVAALAGSASALIAAVALVVK